MPRISSANKIKKGTIFKDPVIAAACWRWTSMKNQINLEGTSLIRIQTGLVSFEIWQFLWRFRGVLYEWRMTVSLRSVHGIVNENNLQVEFPVMRRGVPIWDKEFTGSSSLPPKPSRRLNHMWSDFWAEAEKGWCVLISCNYPLVSDTNTRVLSALSVNISWGLLEPLQLGP